MECRYQANIKATGNTLPWYIGSRSKQKPTAQVKQIQQRSSLSLIHQVYPIKARHSLRLPYLTRVLQPAKRRVVSQAMQQLKQQQLPLLLQHKYLLLKT